MLNAILELEAWGRGAGVEGLALEGSSCTRNARIMLLASVRNEWLMLAMVGDNISGMGCTFPRIS